jgi:hypothetical protein
VRLSRTRSVSYPMRRASRSVNLEPSNRPGLEETMTSREPQDPSPVEDSRVVYQRSRPVARSVFALFAILTAASVGVLLMALRRRTAVVLSSEPADA